MKFYASTFTILYGANALLFHGPRSVPFKTSLNSVGNDSMGNDPSFSPLLVSDNGFLNGDAKRKGGNQNLDNRLNDFENRNRGGSGPSTLGTRLGGFDKGQSSINAQEGLANKIWSEASPILVQGGSLKTWSFASPLVERVHVVMKTEGRPLDADVELWQGPDNTPHKMRVYLEDGCLRPFSAVIETPRGPNTIALRNIGHLEFPFAAGVVANAYDFSSAAQLASVTSDSSPLIVQGGALRTYPFDPSVESIQVLLKTDGRPLNARIELLQGPNNNKQVVEIYTEDGLDRPFYIVIETPGSGNVVRIVNTAPVEFPLTAWVEPYLVGNDAAYLDPVIGGDATVGSTLDRRW